MRAIFKLFRIFYFFYFLFFIVSSVKADTNNDPIVKIHDTIVSPGELLIQVDALNFVEENGQISAITLNIKVDTCLVKFMNIENIQISGGQWLANYNTYMDYISIIFTHYGVGHDLNGKLLDLHLFYNGGFDAPLNIDASSEFVNIALQTIENVDYQDGLIEQTEPAGSIYVGTVDIAPILPFSSPVIAGGVGYDSVSEMFLKLEYDDLLFDFTGLTANLIDNCQVEDSNGVINIHWQDDNYLDLSNDDTLFYLNFDFVQCSSSQISIVSCSKVYNNDLLVASEFLSGDVILSSFPVVLFSDPPPGGNLTGDGIYEIGASVNINAVANQGYEFLNWTKNDSIVSADPQYSFIKEAVCDTFVAHFEHLQYSLTLNPFPENGGDVNGAGNYFYGDSVEVVALPYNGYEFTGWTDGVDTVSFEPVYSFVMPAQDVVLTANFKKKIYTIEAVPNNTEYGVVSGGGQFYWGDTAVLVAIPNQYYKFVYWMEDNQQISYDSIYSFTVTDNRSLVANFEWCAVCKPPSMLWVENLSYSEAELFWEQVDDAAQWKVLWGLQGFDTLNEGNLVENIVENHYLLTGLNDTTNYEFYVKTLCNSGMESAWSEPFGFTTFWDNVFEVNVSKVKIYPNPVKDILTIKFNTRKIDDIINIEIKDLTGRKVYENNFFNNSGNIKIPIGFLNNGVYLLKTGLGNRKILKKIFISK